MYKVRKMMMMILFIYLFAFRSIRTGLKSIGYGSSQMVVYIEISSCVCNLIVG